MLRKSIVPGLILNENTREMAGLKVYHDARSQPGRAVLMLLGACGVPYELHPMDVFKGIYMLCYDNIYIVIQDYYSYHDMRTKRSR